jgi:hypothetical protein
VLAAPAAGAGLTVLYVHGSAAAAIHDGAPGVRGLVGAWRQAPIFDDPRWPPARQIAKVRSSDLAGRDPATMASIIRAALRDGARGGRAAIDEVGTAWDGPDASALAGALRSLGPAARRVVVYVSPGLVGQVARVDPRLPLHADLAAVVDALAAAGDVELSLYHGGGVPFDREEMATAATRWLARWPAAGRGSLHLLLGPDHGLGQAVLWARARSSAAGRTLLANGPGVWGLKTAGEGRAWLAAYRAFLRAPDVSPTGGGDVGVPTGGGLSVSAVGGRRVAVTLSRPGRAVVRLVPSAGGPGRVIAKLTGPGPATVVPLPADVAPGRYWVVAVALGDGLRDRAYAPVDVGSGWARGALSMAEEGRVLRVSVAPGTRAVVRLIPIGGRGRVIGKVQGPARQRTVRLPRDVRPGRYVAVAVSAGAAGRQVVRLGLRIPR